MRGVPGAALPGSALPAECVSPGFVGVLLVQESAGCCGGPTSGRLTKGSHKSVHKGRRAWPAVLGEQWVPRGSGSRCISERWILSVQSAAVSMGSPGKQSGETTWAGMLMEPCRDWDHCMALPVPLHLLSEPRGNFLLQRGTCCTGSQAGLTCARLPDCFCF